MTPLAVAGLLVLTLLLVGIPAAAVLLFLGGFGLGFTLALLAVAHDEVDRL